MYAINNKSIQIIIKIQITQKVYRFVITCVSESTLLTPNFLYTLENLLSSEIGDFLHFFSKQMNERSMTSLQQHLDAMNLNIYTCIKTLKIE